MPYTLRLTTTPSDREPDDLTQHEFTYEQLAAGFRHDVGTKAGRAFIPALFEPAYRLNANAKSMTALVLDLDHLEEGALELIIEALRVKGLAFFYFHTYNYPNARILVPFATPMPLESPEAWSKAAWPSLVKYLGVEDVAKADAACKDPARLYYEPRRPSLESPHRSGFVDGAPLDWTKVPIGKITTPKPAAAPVVIPPGIAEDPSRPVDLHPIREKLKRSGKPLNVKLANGEALSPPPEQRKQGDMARHIAWWHALGALSFATEPWMASEAVLEVARPSWNAEAMASPDDFTPWDKVQSMLEQQRASAPIKKAEFEAARERTREVWEKVLGARFTPKEPADAEGDPAHSADIGADVFEAHPSERIGISATGERVIVQKGSDPSAPVEGALSGDDLVSRLQWKVSDKEGVEPKLIKSLHNLSVMLRESYIWKGALRKNLLSGMIEIHSGPLFAGAVAEFKNVDISNVRHWFVAEFNVEFDLTSVDNYVELAATDNAFDPLVQYLNSLKWDGVPRLDGMLEEYFKAELVDEFTRPVSSKWMISAVARALRPGCQADAMLVLQGKQGIRKSSAARVLGGKWFTDFDYDMASDEARSACSENWIMEVGELSSLSRTQRDQVKQFITKGADKYRAKYARRQDNHLRRCVFIGTTNEDEIFSDETGNRRFWPVNCLDTLDTDGLARDRDQLWAEAVVRFEAGEQWHLTSDEEAVARKEAAKRMQNDSLTEKITDWFLTKAPADRPRMVRSTDITDNALDSDRVPDRSLQIRVGNVLKRLNFTKSRKSVGGVMDTFYHTPDYLLAAPKRARGEGAAGAIEALLSGGSGTAGASA